MKKLIFIFLLLTSSILAQTVDTVRTVAAGGNYQPLGIPRDHIYLSNDGLWMMVFTGWRNGVRVSEDSATTWSASTPISQTNNHTHFVADENDVIYASGLGGNNLAIWTDVFNYNTSTNTITITQTDSTEFIQYGAEVVNAGSFIPLPNSDTSILVSRHDDAANDSLDIYAWFTTDDGATWSNDASKVQISDFTGNNNRIGGMVANNTAQIVADSAGLSTRWKYWNRATQVFDSYNPLFVGYDFVRGYSFTVKGDTQFVAVPSDDGLVTKDGIRIYYAWKRFSDANWTIDSLDGGVTDRDLSVDVMYTSVTYLESSGRLVLVYTYFNTAVTTDVRIACRYWKPEVSQDTWSQEYVLASGNNVRRFSSHKITPTAWGNSVFLVIEDLTLSSTDIIRIDFSGSDFDGDPLASTSVTGSTVISGGVKIQ